MMNTPLSFSSVDVVRAASYSLLRYGAIDGNSNLRRPHDRPPAPLSRDRETAAQRQLSYILYIEDDPSVRLIITRRLENAGYNVRALGNSHDGLALALREPPHLLLVDINLPDGSGLEVCRVVKEKLSSHAPPVIIISARGQPSDISAAQAVGADDYLIKPVAPGELLQHVQRFDRS